MALGSSGAQKYAARLQYQATQDTNAQNYKITQETNAQNYKMFKEQQQFDLDMWNAQNVYNSAENQRARLESAGLNPYLMMDGGSAGTAGSVNSANPIAAQAPHMETPNIGDLYLRGKQQSIDMINNVASAINQFSENLTSQRLADAQVEQLRALTSGFYIDNRNKQRKYDLDFGYTSAATNNIKQDTNLKYENTIFAKNNARFSGLQADFFEKDMQNKLLTSELTNDNLKQSISESKARESLINLDIDAKEVLNKYLEPNQIADLALKSAQLNLTTADINTKLAQTRFLVSQALGQDINNKIVEKTSESLVKSLNARNQDLTSYYTIPQKDIGLPWQNRRQNDYYNWKNRQKTFRYQPEERRGTGINLGILGKWGYDSYGPSYDNYYFHEYRYGK